jgi:ATP synthase F1 complex assembly factor 2
MLQMAKELRAGAKQPGGNSKQTLLKKRFWKDVTVQEVDGRFEIHLDTRPLRHPTTKEVIRLPTSKPNLAFALALEWDMLTSAQQATRHHLIPLTSTVCRALDIRADDEKKGDIRKSIVTTVLRYLDTDTLLCFAAPPDPNNPVLASSQLNDAGRSLRSVQEEVAVETISFLTSNVWPGVEINPVLDGESIMPKAQKPGVREIIEGWVTGLDAWELAALERATLAGKSLLGAARIVAEWSEGEAGLGQRRPADGPKRFGIEEAAKAASVEVDWQTDRWGEVEDTHDVEKEDLRRQLGSAILLVSGTGAAR